jgi:hypothetical protein
VNKRDIVIGLVVLMLLVGIVFWLRRRTKQPTLKLPSPSVEEKLEESFKIEIPEDVEKVVLNDIAGSNASGIATRKFENGRFVHAILADLPDLKKGSFYQGWLVKEEEFVSTGRMRVAKGGYLLEFKSGTDYSDYKKVVVTREKLLDNTPEEHVLEGNF